MGDLYLLDTNVLSYWLDSRNDLHNVTNEFLDSLGDGDVIVVSAVTLAEIEYGLRTAPYLDAKLQAEVRGALAEFSLVKDITRHTVEYYAQLRADLFERYSPRDKRGRLLKKRVEDLIESTTGRELGIQENDLWIAAQALEWNAILVTNDSMKRIASLETNPPLRYRLIV